MVDYCFYANDYLGSIISESEFAEFALRAEQKLAYYKRVYTVISAGEHAEKMAVCAMAEVIASICAAQNGVGAVASASIGSVSVSYGSAASMDLSWKNQERELYEAARIYLDIYRG